MTHSIAIIGVGPRGLYALEHLIDRVRREPPGEPLDVHLIEPGEPGAGAVWRTDLPEYLLMNTVSSQITAFGEDHGGPRGPSLYEWLRERGVAIGPDEYPSRASHGRYLVDAFRAVTRRAPACLRLHVHRCRAVDVAPQGGRHRVVLDASRGSILADVVLLTTGHSEHRSKEHDELLDYARAQNARGFSRTRYLPSVYPLERNIATLGEGTTLGIMGLGLSSIDAIISATLGRGGAFERTADGALGYRPSGREPRILAWSRSGLPLAARGRNQKGVTGRHTPRVFTADRIDELRAQALARRGTRQLSFEDELLPLLKKEMEFVYYRTLRGEGFAERYLACADDAGVRDLVALVPERERFDWEDLTAPLRGKVFDTQEAYRTFLLERMRRCVAAAKEGTSSHPYKAACDVLRDVRGNLRRAVEFGGLTAESHRYFDQQFWPTHMRIAVGPPLVRIEQLCALAEAGILNLFWGEAPVVSPCPERGGFELRSSAFTSPPAHFDVLADGRIYQPDVTTDTSPLVSNLFSRGTIRAFVNRTGADLYAPCGLDITPGYNVIGRDGAPREAIYAIGVMTEGAQMYTPVAASPGVSSRALVEARTWAARVVAQLRRSDERPHLAAQGAAPSAP